MTRRARALVACGLALLTWSSCRAPLTRDTRRDRTPHDVTRDDVTRDDGRATPQPGAPEPAAPRRASGPVLVRLLRFHDRVTHECIDGDGREFVVDTLGGLRVGDGPPVDRLELRAPAGGAVAVNGWRYAGVVRMRLDLAGQLVLENEVDLEDYVLGVVASELGFGAVPPQAWRAQAIAARSYALCALTQRGVGRPDPPYLYDSVRDQAYAGQPQPRNAGERASVDALRRAVESTRGLVLLEDDAYLDARYHSSCGGRTADGPSVFPELRSRCLTSVECAPCARSEDVRWQWTVSRDELDGLARRHAIGPHVNELRVTRTDGSQRWIEVELIGELGARRVRFEELRREFGARRLRSALVHSSWPQPGAPIAGGLALRGAGFGHGAGLCQRGAMELARQGWSAERILEHYYTGARIEDRR